MKELERVKAPEILAEPPTSKRVSILLPALIPTLSPRTKRLLS